MTPAPPAMEVRRVLVTGATGYIGGRLVPELLAAGVQVRCLVRSPARLTERPWSGEVEVVAGDLSDPRSLVEAMEGVDAAYYLIHSMGGGRDFAKVDREAAAAFRDAAAADAGVKQILYLGGLGGHGLSHHLASRQEVGEVLASGPVPVTELRAAVIIGSGSASFEMLRHLVEVLPVLVTPRWVSTKCQPIAIRDVLAYLVGVLGRPDAMGRVLEIGGPDVLSYREMLDIYAEEAGLHRRLVLPVPVLTPGLSSLWVGLVTPLPTSLARPLIDGLGNEVVVTDRAIEELVPRTPVDVRSAIALALGRTRSLEVTTTWAGALGARTAADPVSTDPPWSGGTVLDDRQELLVTATPEALYRVVTGVGGKRGWYVAELLWDLRGLADRVLGGPGMRRGRRHPDELRVGEVVDFWRAEALVPGRLVRLRAEMRLPGDAWLEWTMEPAGDEHTVFTQTARFRPRGVWGRLYWFSLLPFHSLIFKPLAYRLADAASETDAPAPAGASRAPGA